MFSTLEFFALKKLEANVSGTNYLSTLKKYPKELNLQPLQVDLRKACIKAQATVVTRRLQWMSLSHTNNEWCSTPKAQVIAKKDGHSKKNVHIFFRPFDQCESSSWYEEQQELVSCKKMEQEQNRRYLQFPKNKWGWKWHSLKVGLCEHSVE